MIVSKTPLRMSFVGGGSDLPAFYIENGGAVLSTAINAFVYVIIKERFENGIRLSYSRTENVRKPQEIQHPLVRNAFKIVDINDDVEIVSIADIPSSGTGLGSSSSFSVGLLNAMYKYNGQSPSKEHLANKACELEIDLCKSPIGKQDQYAAAYGGIKVYRFKKDGTVGIENINMKSETKAQLNDEIICFYIGGNRSANEILKDQNNRIHEKQKKDLMLEMVSFVDDLKEEFENNQIINFGDILHKNWILKKQLAKNIANSRVDEIYDTARNIGAKGGKLLGAGGGGFMIFHTPTNAIKDSIRKKFSCLREVNFNIEENGSEIIKLN